MGLTTEYPNLNKALNEYCLWLENSQFLNNLSYFYHLTIDLQKLIKKDFTCSKLEEYYTLSQEDTSYLSLTETVELVTKYLEERLPEYKTTFLRSLSDGTINIVADPSDEYENNKSNEAGRDEKKHLFANVVLKHTTEDPSTLIHEFLHTINNEEINTITRRYITEAISIYFESDICEYMKKNGFTEEEIIANDIFRMLDFVACVDELLPLFSIIDSFRHLGPINSDSYNRMRTLNILPIASTKEAFYEGVNYYEEKLAAIKKKNESLHLNNPVLLPNALKTFGYVIGTLISYYAIENNTDDLHQRMIDLNTMVNKGTLSSFLDYLGIDISNEEQLEEKIAPPLQKKIKKIKDYCTGQKNIAKEK